MTGADLEHADLAYADLSYVDASCATFLRADFSYANLFSMDFSGADIKEADFEFAYNVPIENLCNSKNWEFAVMPKYIEIRLLYHPACNPEPI